MSASATHDGHNKSHTRSTVGKKAALFSVSVVSARHQLMLWDQGYGAIVSHGVPVYSQLLLVLCVCPQRMARLSLPWWLVIHRDGLPTHSQSPIQD